MARLITIGSIALLSAINGSDAFAVSRPAHSSVALRMSEEDTLTQEPGKVVERGVSVDQDGKSNVWAIEPKMEVDSKSSEEKTTSTIIAAGGLAAFAAVAAGILTNLPDPDQF
mmetsp:Transcript_17211/g.24328  ORF Transcript_17211/g.24328 Transcript_17211/m.24328 type:complete len:113 (+) Transcript_17211:72-410(+)